MRVHFFLDEQKDKPSYKFRDLDVIPRIGEAVTFPYLSIPYRVNDIIHLAHDIRMQASVIVVASIVTDYTSKITINKISSIFVEKD